MITSSDLLVQNEKQSESEEKQSENQIPMSFLILFSHSRSVLGWKMGFEPTTLRTTI
jgi:hypothetical protein